MVARAATVAATVTLEQRQKVPKTKPWQRTITLTAKPPQTKIPSFKKAVFREKPNSPWMTTMARSTGTRHGAQHPQEDPSDYSVHQLLTHDDGREGSDDSGDSDDGAAAEIAKNKAMPKNDHFDSEDTTDDDSFIQNRCVSRRAKQPMDDDDGDEDEHGDMEANACIEDPSEYSVHQSLALMRDVKTAMIMVSNDEFRK